MKEIQVFGELKRDVLISDIGSGPNSRMEINEGHLDLLMGSMRAIGLMEPVGLIEKDDGTLYPAYGFRRLAAAKKLGWKTISAVIRQEENEWHAGVMNLAENIQRRQVSLSEVGKYIIQLQEQGVGDAEIAVSIGSTKEKVRDSVRAYLRIPEEHRRNIKADVARTREVGTIPISTANRIENSRQRLGFKKPIQTELFKLAKVHGKSFHQGSIEGYAKNLMAGKKWNQTPEGVKNKTWFKITNAEDARIKKKYIDSGRYDSFAKVVQAIVTGKIKGDFKILDDN